MATRKWVAEDGKQFESKAEVDAYEAREPHVKNLLGMVGDADLAVAVYNYFEKNFRVPVKRAKRAAVAPAPAPKLVVKKDNK